MTDEPDPKAVEALKLLRDAISDVEENAMEIAKVAARLYYWEQREIRAKVQASAATVLAMATHPAGGIAVFVAMNNMFAARWEVKECQRQIKTIQEQIDNIGWHVLKWAERITLEARTQSRVEVAIWLRYRHPRGVDYMRKNAAGEYYEIDKDGYYPIRRRMPMRLVYWVCVICGRGNYEVMYPNKIPVYCQPSIEEAEEGLLSECQRKGLAEKQHKYYVRQRLQEDEAARTKYELNKFQRRV